MTDSLAILALRFCVCISKSSIKLLAFSQSLAWEKYSAANFTNCSFLLNEYSGGKGPASFCIQGLKEWIEIFLEKWLKTNLIWATSSWTSQVNSIWTAKHLQIRRNFSVQSEVWLVSKWLLLQVVHFRFVSRISIVPNCLFFWYNKKSQNSHFRK